MSTTISLEDFRLLRDYIEEHCGIYLSEEKVYLIETRLTKLMALNGCENFNEFYHKIKDNSDEKLKDKIIDAMTTNETLWFRDAHPFQILQEVILPHYAAQIRKGTKIKVRIWSGASSTGQEAYSIAMTIFEFCKKNPDIRPEHFEIVGTDISASALFLANAGRYDQIAMSRGLDEETRNEYFEQDGNVWQVKDKVKALATFKKFNLQDSPVPLGRFDVVFLRYVAIYFSEDFKRNLFNRIETALNPPGYFIIGAVESLRGLNEKFGNVRHGNGYYYTLDDKRNAQ
jgi:chemotaxis protein methyltransferase CheR